MPDILIIEKSVHDCETFCHDCGQLRLWLKGVKAEACAGCGSKNIETDVINGTRLPLLREQYSKE